jgi:diguanylate cyclase (GGDEF)-like protein
MERDDLLKLLEALSAEGPTTAYGYAVILFQADDGTRRHEHFGTDAAAAVRHHLEVTAQQFIRRRGHVGRWDDDQFLCVLPHTDATTAVSLAEQLRARLARQIVPVADSVTTMLCSLGAAAAPDHGTTVPSLLAAVEQALHQAQQAGGNRVAVAGGAPSAASDPADMIEEALRAQRVTVAYQTIFDLENGQPVAEEALARLITRDDRVLTAGEFIDAANRLQLTHQIDTAIVAAALARGAEARARGSALPRFIKLSSNLLHHPEPVRAQLAAASGATGLVLEIAEPDLPADPAATRKLFAPFLELGVKFTLDNFGCSPTSLRHLAELLVAFVKIDGRLIQRLHESWVRVMVRRLSDAAGKRGLITVAEFVEQERQANILREIGVRWAQGHYFSRALIDEKDASARRRLNARPPRGYNLRRSGQDS